MENNDHDCSLCKVSYASETELEDHKWSLMHHIKIEKTKKGAPHSCNMCLQSCANIIEYGKHLNEDHHKLALSRRAKEGNEMLDSFASQDKVIDIVTEADLKTDDQKTVNKHRWSYSRADEYNDDVQLNSFGMQLPGQNSFYVQGNLPHWEELRQGGANFYELETQYGQKDRDKNNQNISLLKVPRTAIGHHRSNSDVRFNYNNAVHNHGYRCDGEYNRNDNHHWNRKGIHVYNFCQKKVGGSYQDQRFDIDGRRGSFDSSLKPNFHVYKNDRNNLNVLENTYRGQEVFKGKIVRGRERSYDYNSPESVSSLDSELKCKLNSDDAIAPDKSRRKLSPRSDINRYSVKQSDRSLRNLINEKSNNHPGNRNTSHDRSVSHTDVGTSHNKSMDHMDVDTEIPHLTNSSIQKVKWTNQQSVTSTTNAEQDVIKKGHANDKKKGKKSSSVMLPDSSSESLNKKKNIHKERLKKKTDLTGDNTESVLEKAEKLCKKLRNEREKAKEKRQMKEKEKKNQITNELNAKIEELSEKNKCKIKGVLDVRSDLNENASSDVSKMTNTEPSQGCRLSEDKFTAPGFVNLPVPSLDAIAEPDSRKDKEKVPSSISTKTATFGRENGSNKTSFADKIAQTKADIDLIRAKVESSVRPVIACSPAALSKDFFVSPSRGQKGNETSSLLKMVNSPRSTKERLQLANMLRDYAKSQTKCSVPRFNLRFSDLCNTDNDRQIIPEINIESLSPSIQLEIADIIESDVKPDITKLEKILEMASMGNVELHSTILSELGLKSEPSSISLQRMASPVTATSTMYSPILGKDDLCSGLFKQSSYMTGHEIGVKSIFNERSQSPYGRSSSPLTTPICDRQTPLSAKNITRDQLKQKVNMQDLNQVNLDKTKSIGKSSNDIMKENACLPSTQTASSVPLFPSSFSPSNLSDSRLMSFARVKQEIIDGDYQDMAEIGKYFSGKAVTSLYPGTNSVPLSASTLASSKFGKGIDEVTALKFHSDTPISTEVKYKDNIDVTNIYTSKTVSMPLPVVHAVQADDSWPSRSLPLRRSIHTQNLYRNVDELPVKDIGSSRALNYQREDMSALQKVTSILDGVPVPVVDAVANQLERSRHLEKGERDIPVLEKALDSSMTSQESILDEVYRVSMNEEHVRQEISTADQKINQLKRLIEEASQQLDKFNQERQTLIEKEKSYRLKRMKLLEESRSSSVYSPSVSNIFNMSNLSRSQLDNPVFVKFLLSKRQSDTSSVGGFSNVETGSQPDMERQRKDSVGSTISEPVFSAAETLTPRITDRKLSSQSLDALSGSAETLTSSLQLKLNDANKGTVIPIEKCDEKFGNKSHKSVSLSNSFSLLNNPLEKVGFVTLDSLLKGETDIGKFLKSNLENREKISLQKHGSHVGQSIDGSLSKQSQVSGERSLSIGSDGSDSEKKVTMKYMGTIPEGINYETFVKHMSQENKDKSLVFTVINSPDMSQQKKASGVVSDIPEFLQTRSTAAIDFGYKSDESSKTSTHTLTDVNDGDTQSVMSTYSLGEQIKRLCDVNTFQPSVDKERSKMFFERNETSKSSEEFLSNGHWPHIMDTEISSKLQFTTDANATLTHEAPVKDCFVNLTCIECGPNTLKHKLSPVSPKTVAQHEFLTPSKKKLKSKKERDQMSRRKQKESFILHSDTNSEEENESCKLNQSCPPGLYATKSEEDLVHTGSEDRTPRPIDTPNAKSLLDAVKLEVESMSDSYGHSSGTESVKNTDTSVLVKYQGPALSVVAIQEFKGELFVCYNGCEIRRFDLKTGNILKELDCSPFLVSCLHIVSVENRHDVLYTGGVCKKLMMFEPKNFRFIGTFDYNGSIMCLHDNWGRLFIGKSDGGVSVRSLQSDKELNTFNCTLSSVHALASSSAGMTKMLCLATGDNIIYIVDAITGLLLTMLKEHTCPPVSLQICGQKVISGSLSLMVHNISSGDLLNRHSCETPISCLWIDNSYIYVSCHGSLIQVYNDDLILSNVINAGTSIVTCGTVCGQMILTGNREGLVEGRHISLAGKESSNAVIIGKHRNA